MTFGNTLSAQKSIPSPDAKKHIGETIEVIGKIYNGKIKRDKTKPDSLYEILYLGANYPKEDFIIIIKMKSFKGDSLKLFAQNVKFEQNKEGEYKGSFANFSATGKIFLYEGKPAIMLKEDQIALLEPTD
jgi:hypothetical protein